MGEEWELNPAKLPQHPFSRKNIAFFFGKTTPQKKRMKKTVLIGVFFKIQVKFAAALGVSKKKVSAWEHGKATPDETETEKIRGG